MFQSLPPLKVVDLSQFCPVTQREDRAKQILFELQNVPDIHEDVFSKDNTNSIEGYFSIIKSRLKKNTSTLVDNFIGSITIPLHNNSAK